MIFLALFYRKKGVRRYQVNACVSLSRWCRNVSDGRSGRGENGKDERKKKIAYVSKQLKDLEGEQRYA